ncbi:hypothetical protein [Nitrosomonas communis]|uniref:Uncharacterized protein n=1 Tax=Nitrosomonas communis TaxID=44574 RepID=A0A1I4VQX7_9PROT|nr:hypothetical protein [Nitrosomonas communis]SFN03419.1 hypothetical protein SAMN05421863_108812 [Nitrosomonas communis]
MKNLLLSGLIAASFIFSNVHAAETVTEKNKAVKDDIKRDAHEEMHRVDEATCTGTDTECAERKVEHRSKETKEVIKDKSSEIKNKVD